MNGTTRGALLDTMSDVFGRADLQRVCFDLGIMWDEIPADTFSVQAAALLTYAERHDMVPALIAELRHLRPRARWPEMATPQPAAGRAGMTVLVLAANPTGTTPLRIDAEVREIDQHIRMSAGAQRITLAQAWAVRTTDLVDAMLRYRPTVVHFSGHGADGDLMFEDATGQGMSAVAPSVLADLCGVVTGVRAVVLNACWSDSHAVALARRVDCVVGMTRAISDVAAIAFAAGLYRALGAGLDIGRAVTLGRVAVAAQPVAGAGDETQTPRLRIRDGLTADGIILCQNVSPWCTRAY